MQNAIYPMLHLKLLGPPDVRLGTSILQEGASKKALALLFYLATTERIHSRDELASLFWCEMPDAQARKNLRNILPMLRALLGSYLSITRHTVEFKRTVPYSLDVEQFRAALEGNRQQMSLALLRQALALYTGDFLMGFYIADSPVFEEWMTGQREHLHGLVIAGLNTLATRALQQREYQQGLEAAQRLLRLEPWSERAHQLQMELMAASGERDRAMMQYEQCRRVLIDEFGVEPTRKTTELYKQIKAGTYTPIDSTPQLSRSIGRIAFSDEYTDMLLAPEPPANQVPQPEIGTLYGREFEISRLFHWLTVDKCQLILLNGQVGSGKTALARALVEGLSQPTRYRAIDGGCGGKASFERIFWRSLRDLPALDQLLSDWLEPGVIQPEAGTIFQLESLFAQLRRHRCLIVLDDSEILNSRYANSEWLSAYRRLIEGVVSGEHQSCLLLIGREQLPLGSYFETTSPHVRSLCLNGLDCQSARSLLADYPLRGNPIWYDWLIGQYDGTPLFLHLGARAIQRMFHGDLDALTSIESPLFDAICAALDTEYTVLDRLEQRVLQLLANYTRPRSFSQLLQALQQRVSSTELLQALQHLQRRSLLLTTDDGFALLQIVRLYIHLQSMHRLTERTSAYAGNYDPDCWRHCAWGYTDRAEAAPEPHSRLAHAD